jgi:two-component system cell cycle sensor histidine kinase/response regulator CckA
MLRRLVGEGVGVRTVAGNVPGKVRADRSQLEQVLVNLAVNARDAMPTGGDLTIETAEVELAGEDGLGEPRRYLLLAVSDTGVGMTAEVKARAFEPFFTTKENGATAGLGLATVYGIVEQSGGHVWAYSEPGRGAAFKVYLPLVAEAGEPRRPGAGAPAAALEGRECVLLLEDEQTVRNVVGQMLAAKGYTVLEAGHGDEALAVAEAHEGRIDVVVSDVVMPRMSGPEFVQRLRAVRPDVRVLFISGYTDDTVVHHGVLDDGVVFLQKPFAGAALARKVREALDGPVPELPLVVR